MALGCEVPGQGQEDVVVPLGVYLLSFPNRWKGRKMRSFWHKLPLLDCKGGLTYMTMLAMRLSGKT